MVCASVFSTPVTSEALRSCLPLGTTVTGSEPVVTVARRQKSVCCVVLIT